MDGRPTAPRSFPFPPSGAVNENHPVLFALDAELEALQETYSREPNEHNRYQLVRLESLIAQWAPQRAAAI